MNMELTSGLSWAVSQKPHFSQRTREMGHPDYEDAWRMGDVGHPPPGLRGMRGAWEMWATRLGSEQLTSGNGKMVGFRRPR
jgi:hypothetical protein